MRGVISYIIGAAKMKVIVLSLLGFSVGLSSAAYAGGPYTSKIEKIVEAGDGSPYTAVWLDYNFTSSESSCGSTVTHDRVTIKTERQLAVLLAAVMADAEVSVYIDGNACGTAGIDDLTSVFLAPPA